MQLDLNQNFREFIELLEDQRVDYLVVGGYAVGVHGFPRYTGDIDFFVAISESNAAKLQCVFEQFGFGDIGIQEADFLTKDFVVEIGREPQKIQVLTGIDGVDFEACKPNALVIQDGDLRIKFIGFQDLIENKKASGRPKDRLDVEPLTGDESN